MFYTELSRHYDEIFSVSSEEMAFLTHTLKACVSLLDIGCGTGNKTEFFSEPGRNVIGIDLDKGMIAAAARDHAAPGITYEVLDMRAIGMRFRAGAFDGILCLGNTLVHLDGLNSIRRFLKTTGNLLSRGGILVVQILNYDALKGPDDVLLPVLETDQVCFTRRYVWRGGNMHFVTGIELKKTGTTLENDIVLVPLLKADLEDALLAAGLINAKWYGGYGGQSLEKSSFVSISVSRKA